MKLLYVIFAIAAFTGVIMLKGYNAMGCAYMACMSLFCVMCLSMKISAVMSKDRGVAELNPDEPEPTTETKS